MKTRPENFSILRAFRAHIAQFTSKEGVRFDEVTLLTFKRGQDQIREAGQVPMTNMCIPIDLNCEKRGDILAGTATAGAEIVAEGKLTMLAPLRNKSVLIRAGSQFITGLQSNSALPEYAGSTAAWKDEVAAADDAAGAHSDVSFYPYRATGILNISRLFLQQDTVEADKVLANDLVAAVMDRLELTILSNDAESAGVSPVGFLLDANDKFSGSAGVTWTQAIDLITAVQGTKSGGNNCCFIIHPDLVGLLKKTDRGTATGRMIIENGFLAGYPVLESCNVSKTLHTTSDEYGIIFLNPEHVIITQYGGFEILLDPVSIAKQGKVRLVIHSYMDCKLRNSEALAFGSALLA